MKPSPENNWGCPNCFVDCAVECDFGKHCVGQTVMEPGDNVARIVTRIREREAEFLRGDGPFAKKGGE